MRIILPILIMALIWGCTPENNGTTQDTDTVYHRKKVIVYETETVQVHKRQVVIEHTDTVQQLKKTTPQPIKKITTPNPVKKTPEKKPVKTPVYKMPTDTQYVYYSNSKKISVKTSPWKNDQRTIQLFDMNGQLTYTFEDKHFSYSIITILKHRPNGSVESANTSMNPGASRYWYETEITFSSTNQPLTKVDTQMPMEHLTPTEKEYWDEKKKQWVKQLTIECQPVPAPKQ